MFTVALKTRTPIDGFHSAVQLELSDGREIVNFQTSSDAYDFECMMLDHAKKHGIITVIDQGSFYAYHHDEYELGLFVDSVFDCLNEAFEGWDVTPCRIWKYRLESIKGGSIYFLGDQKDEAEWIKINLTKVVRVEMPSVCAN